MADPRMEKLEQILLAQLPTDGKNLGNGQLLAKWAQAAGQAGELVTEADFVALREALVARGLVVKGKGRGGATGRAAASVPRAEDFDLKSDDVPGDSDDDMPAAPRKTKAPPSKLRSANDGEAQRISEFLSIRGSASRRDLLVDCFGRHQPAAVVDAAIAHLIEQAPGRVSVEVRPRSKGGPGRPATVYSLARN